MKQEILNRAKYSIKGLSVLRSGDGVGRLEFKSEEVRTARRELTPADTLATTLLEYFNSIPSVRESRVIETVSPELIVKQTIFSRGWLTNT